MAFLGIVFKLGESRKAGRMGAAWECLRSEGMQSLPCAGGQGARAHDVLFILQGRVTELNNGLGTKVKRRCEAHHLVLLKCCQRRRRGAGISLLKKFGKLETD